MTESSNFVKKTTFGEKFITYLFFFQWLIYENVILLEPVAFGGDIFLFIVFGFKLILPFLLCYIVGLPPKWVIKSPNFLIYIALFLLFIFWGVIPTLISGTIISWFKIIPLFFFLLASVSFFSKHLFAFNLFAKCIIIYTLTALVQFLLLYLVQDYQESGSFPLAGPWGLFGNIQGKFGLPGIDFTIVRLCGFWREPSLASGTCYVSFFLCKYLVKIGENKFWNFVSYFCMLAGILTLSNAGYLAFASSLLGVIFFNLRIISKRFLYILLVLPLIIVMVWGAIFGRQYFAENGSDNPFLLAAVGVRSAGNINSNDFDPSDGRLDLMQYTLEETSKNIIGKGIQVTGSTGIKSPSGGLLFWMLLTGYPGALLILLLATFPILLNFNIKDNSTGIISLGQALIVLFVQQSSYGSWLDPNYIILSSLLLVLSIRKRNSNFLLDS